MPDSSTQQIPGLKQKKVFKIIVLGDSGVGKTCLTYRFCEGQFLDKSEATIGVDFRERNIKINNEDIKLQLWDTAGQERFRKSMVQHYYRNVHAVVIVYDVTKPETFHIFVFGGYNTGLLLYREFRISRQKLNCRTLMSVLSGCFIHGRIYDKGNPIAPAGSHRSVEFYLLRSIASWMNEVESHGLTGAPRVLVGNKCDCGTPESRLATTYAQRLADKHGMPLFETSALLDSECDNVESIFMTLAHKLYSKQPLRVVSIEGERVKGVVTLQRQKSRSQQNPGDSCLCS